jgi:hypothetical protein
LLLLLIAVGIAGVTGVDAVVNAVVAVQKTQPDAKVRFGGANK